MTAKEIRLLQDYLQCSVLGSREDRKKTSNRKAITETQLLASAEPAPNVQSGALMQVIARSSKLGTSRVKKRAKMARPGRAARTRTRTGRRTPARPGAPDRPAAPTLCCDTLASRQCGTADLGRALSQTQ